MSRKYLALLVPVILAQAPWAAAQVALPAVRLPTLPGVGPLSGSSSRPAVNSSALAEGSGSMLASASD